MIKFHTYVVIRPNNCIFIGVYASFILLCVHSVSVPVYTLQMKRARLPWSMYDITKKYICIIIYTHNCSFNRKFELHLLYFFWKICLNIATDSQSSFCLWNLQYLPEIHQKHKRARRKIEWSGAAPSALLYPPQLQHLLDRHINDSHHTQMSMDPARESLVFWLEDPTFGLFNLPRRRPIWSEVCHDAAENHGIASNNCSV